MKKLLVLLFVSLFLCFSLFSQETTGELTGKVTLADGSVLPGVLITVKGSGLIGKKNILSDENGSYRLPMLPPGKYNLTFTLDGFKKKVINGIELRVGKTLNVGAVMEVGVIEESVVVDGSAPLIDVRQSSTLAGLNKESFEKLPRGRDFTSLMSNLGGVNYEKGSGGSGYFFNGGSLSENTFFVDGVNTTSLLGGLGEQRVDIDCVEEVQIKSAGYAAEYGGSMGGVISVITKSGSNEFHGDLSLYYEADWLTAKEKAPLVLNPHDNMDAIYDDGQEKDEFSVIEPSFSLGGYLKKDKAWFFINFSPQFHKITRTGRFVYAPQHNGEKFDEETKRYKGSVKLSFSLNNSMDLSIGGSFDWQKKSRELPNRAGTSTYHPDAWDKYSYKWPTATLYANFDWRLSNAVFLNLSTGYFRRNEKSAESSELDNLIEFMEESGNAQLNPTASLVRPAGFKNMPLSEFNRTDKYLQERKRFKGDLTHFFNLAGDHVLKAGVNISRQSLDLDKGQAAERWQFHWRNDAAGLNKDWNGNPTTYGWVKSIFRKTLGKTHNGVISIYLQDSWTLGNNLTINYGLRVEKEKMPTFWDEYPSAYSFDFFDKLAPRVGFAWDIKGNGKHKLFGSYGIYYDVLKLDFALGSLGAETYWVTTYDIASLDWTQYLKAKGAYLQGGNPYDNTDPIAGGRRLHIVDNRPPVNPDTMVQPDMKPFSKMELTLGYSIMLSDKVSLTITGIYNKVLDAIEDIAVMGEDGHEHWIPGNPGSDWIRERLNPSTDDRLPFDYVAPKAKRKYRALKIDLERKFANNWFGGFSMTWSKLSGNFSGLASSDEGNRLSISANSYFDTWFVMLKQDLTEANGVLPTDRPIDMRLYGAYVFDFGLTVGANASIKSGTPVTRYVNVNWGFGYAPEGRGTLGRTPTLWQINAYLQQEIELGEKLKLGIELNINNITNNKIAYNKWSQQEYVNFHVDNEILRQGYNIDDLMIDLGIQEDPRYLKEYNFQLPLNAQLGIKLSF